VAIPENCLVRFLDVTVQPGYTYEYRVRIKMANPNYNQPKLVAYPSLAKDKELLGEWVSLPPVNVPNDVYWYVLDDKPSDKVTVQLHRWLDVLKVNQDRKIAVADWSIVPKYDAHRGEYIGRTIPVELPTWDRLEEEYQIARDTKTRQKTKIPVDFAVKVEGKQFPALLIDYEGGKGTHASFGGKQITEDAPVQLLVLSPEGRLVVQSSIDDLTNDERALRVDAWKKRLDDVKRAKTTKATPGQGLFDRGSMPGASGSRGGGGN
jgi:hypothetical protein